MPITPTKLEATLWQIFRGHDAPHELVQAGLARRYGGLTEEGTGYLASALTARQPAHTSVGDTEYWLDSQGRPYFARQTDELGTALPADLDEVADWFDRDSA